MDGFSLDDVRETFAADMRQVLGDLLANAEVAANAEALTTASAEAQARVALLEAAEDACHAVSGSSAQVGATGLAQGAQAVRALLGSLRQACDALALASAEATRLGQAVERALPDLGRLLDLELDHRRADADALAGTLAVAAGLDQPSPAEPVDPIVLEAFAAEAAELVDHLDHLTLDLDAGTDTTAALMRTWHTLKGAANTVGLAEVGAVAHRAEDLLEQHAAQGGAPGPGLVATLLESQRTVRRMLGQAEPAPLQPEVRAPNEVVVPEVPPEVEAARTIRVGADQLDRLMALAGELVQDRVRLRTRVSLLQDFQRDLSTSRHRLAATVATFRERYEFSGLDGRPASFSRPADPAAGFTDLELDRYEDIHVLARSLTEIDGDMAEIQARISGGIGGMDEDADAVARVVADLQAGITRARMVPVGQLFTRLRLAARDAAQRLGRSVQIALAGDDLTLDRGIIDGVAGPLLHLVRNSVAHGIAPEEVREGRGKPPVGTITLTARQDSGQMVLEVRDDGDGLNFDALAAKGRALGLLSAGADDQAIADLVFVPGISTSAATDAVSGRGIGCDAARREIQRLGGSLRVLSRRGEGTVFIATLPMTLAITRALLVRQGGQRFAVPMVFLEHLLDLDSVEVVRSAGSARLWWDGDQVPLRRLGDLFGLPGREEGPVLLLRLGDQRWALQVDHLGIQTDIVVGSLGHLLSGHPLFAGATITGDGDLVPIIDVAGLLLATPASLPEPSHPMAVLAEGPVGPAVLFVDDSLSVRRAAEAALVPLGVRVFTAVDGEDALVRLRQGGIDLVFTDLEMPRLNGYDLLREIRAVPAWKDLPVVVVTSRAGGKHRDLAAALGASGYVTKPFSAEALAAFLPRTTP